MSGYYNTTQLGGEHLRSARAAAAKQDAQIATWFRINQNTAATPSTIWSLVFERKVPLTSVRRSMTTLTNRGVLRKMEEQAPGIYGRPEHYWVYNEQQDLFA